MRALAVVAALVIAPVAVAADTNPAAANGVIKQLSRMSITVHAAFDISCSIGAGSPKASAFPVGRRVQIACAGGRLTELRRSYESTGVPSTTVTSGYGAITALSAGSITVGDSMPLTCTVADESPPINAFRVSIRVKIGCEDGVLTAIVGSTASGPVVTVTKGWGAISSLSPTSIAIFGTAPITCGVGPGSPNVTNLVVGREVEISCTNGVLTTLAFTTHS